eukprot:COSAG06_NODE_28765_length_568_cov_1.688699_1_plen_79_part_10
MQKEVAAEVAAAPGAFTPPALHTAAFYLPILQFSGGFCRSLREPCSSLLQLTADTENPRNCSKYTQLRMSGRSWAPKNR